MPFLAAHPRCRSPPFQSDFGSKQQNSDWREQSERNKSAELLYKGLRSLPEKQRSRLIAYYFLGMSKAEIARNEGSSVNSVKEGIQRALRNLQNFFEVFLR